uniref:Uncharacterized protein n=1 Tax=Anguilla anguilla TaxID=7936 RepID=A0A0E9SUJ4_ANGAN
MCLLAAAKILMNMQYHSFTTSQHCCRTPEQCPYNSTKPIIYTVKQL